MAEDDRPGDRPPGGEERRAREERIARRAERRRRHRAGRFRPGLARGVPWQFAPPSQRAQEEALDHEIEIIANAVADRGPIEEDELRTLVGAKYWGPGRFRPAVREALAEGRVVRSGRRRLAPPPRE